MVSDISDLLQAFDIFVFPSFWEGLSVSVVEAQAAGVPVLMSDSITDEVVICDNVQSLSLNDSTDKWANTAISLSEFPRKDCNELIKKSGWDIYDCGQKLNDYYKSVE
ncbi:MAG: glycosyltransferase [Clostridiales bacterium]|nr:glycosyltransferase [Clostridiales bacterium]